MILQQTLTTFFAIMSLAVLSAALLVGVAWFAAKFTEYAPLMEICDAVRRYGIVAAAAVTATATAGSLYYSEVVGFIPCQLCWIQRIFMYSLAAILVVAAIRRDTGIWVYGVALATLGFGVSVYHVWIQAAGSETQFCTLEAPCSERHIWDFGFVSIPFMAMSAFLFTIVALLLVGHNRNSKDEG